MDVQEKFFEDHNISCACRVGYVVCINCRTYYGFLGKLRLILFGDFYK
jgi:hypothetical protein